MKKVMTALAVAATALLAFGDLPSGTSFEGLTSGDKRISDLVGHNDSGVAEDNYYWLSGAADQNEVALCVTNDVTSSQSRPTQFAGATNEKSLHIDVSSPLYRTINPANEKTVSTLTGQAIGDGLYLDTLVKFTAADQVFGDDALSAGDKIAIEYVATDDASNPITNFVIRAGYVDVANGQVTTKNYIMNPVANFEVNDWHRLTVRTIANVTKNDNSPAPVGFVVYLDGAALTYSTSEAAGDPDYVNSLNSTVTTYLYNDSTHALLPSAMSANDNGYDTLSAVAFQGNGTIDDISFTATKPDTVPVEGLTVTIAWDAGVSSVIVNDGTSNIYTNDSIAAAGSTDLLITGDVSTLTVTATYVNGSVAGTWNTENGGSISGSTFTIESGATLNIVSIIPKFVVGGNYYATANDAVRAAVGTEGSPATIQLYADVSELITVGSANGYVVIDLAGKTITGSAGADAAIVNEGANLQIINSGDVLGHIVPGSAEYAVLIAGGTTAISGGSFDGSIGFETAYPLSLTGGQYAGASGVFYLNTYVASGYEATYNNNGYFTVAEKSAEPTTWAEVLGAAVDGAYEIDDLAELKDFQKYVGTFPTANVTFKLTTDIALDAAWPGIGVKGGKDIVGQTTYDDGAFQGTFDGQNHTISNFLMENGTDYGALFNSIYKATIKNLKLSWGSSTLCANSSASGGDTGASFVGVAKASTLQNLTTVAGTVTTVSASKDFGGIVGYLMAGSTVESCTNALNVASLKGGRKCGGIAIITQGGTGTAVLRNCKNSGTSAGGAQDGGIVGYIGVATEIDGCENTAAVQLFKFQSGSVTASGVNKGNATVRSSDASVAGLRFATVDGTVATFVADNALALNGSYKVMATGATATFAFAEAGTIAFDTALFTPTYAITAAEGLTLTNATSGTVKTYTAAAETTPVQPGGTDGETYNDAQVATNAAEKVVVSVPEAVTNAGVDATEYASMFEAKVVENNNGTYSVVVDLKPAVEAAIQANVDDATETALEEVLKVAADTAASVTVTTKPGLYYQIVTGNALPLAEPDAKNWTMATGTEETIQVTKPAGDAAFFKVYCTPAK